MGRSLDLDVIVNSEYNQKELKNWKLKMELRFCLCCKFRDFNGSKTKKIQHKSGKRRMLLRRHTFLGSKHFRPFCIELSYIYIYTDEFQCAYKKCNMAHECRNKSMNKIRNLKLKKNEQSY